MGNRTVTYSSYLDRYQALTGIVTMDATQTANAAQYFTRNIRKAWETYEWPFSMVCESRTPSSGVIAYDQAGTTVIAEVFGTWSANPFTDTSAAQLSYTLTSAGIQFIGTAPTAAYVHYRSGVPSYTGAAFSALTVYTAGQQVYYATTGDFYLCILLTTAGDLPTDVTHWTRITVPYDLIEYVCAASAGDLLLANGQNERGFSLRGEAKELLFDAIEKYSRQQAYRLPRQSIFTHVSQSSS